MPVYGAECVLHVQADERLVWLVSCRGSELGDLHLSAS